MPTFQDPVDQLENQTQKITRTESASSQSHSTQQLALQPTRTQGHMCKQSRGQRASGAPPRNSEAVSYHTQQGGGIHLPRINTKAFLN